MSSVLPQHSRVDLVELKLEIGKRIGLERASRYFANLSRFLNHKVSKAQFDKLCFVVLGRENIHLHNQLICSIVKNACHANVPPPLGRFKNVTKSGQETGGNSPAANDEIHPSPSTVLHTPGCSNGGVLSPPYQKCRSGIWERKLSHTSSPHEINGIVVVTNQYQFDITTERENGSLTAHGPKRSAEDNPAGSSQQYFKRPRIAEQMSHDQNFVRSVNVPKVDQKKDATSRSPVRAPLGVSFFQARRSPLTSSASIISSFTSNSYLGELCSTKILQKRMEHVAEAEGLGKVTMDCANLLNSALDAYLKRLIKPCLELAEARSGDEPIKQLITKESVFGRIRNGLHPGNDMHVQGGIVSLEKSHPCKSWLPVSLLDFKLAMELNLQQLGGHWPFQLERISFEE